MNNRNSFSFPSFLIFVAIAFFANGCVDANYPYGGGYNDPYSGGYSGGYRDNGYGRRHDSDYDRRDRHERRDLERERDRVEEERRHLEEERRRHEAEQQREHQQRREERCPSGYQPSENKCSTEERRRGCSDMRLPGGLGCVRR